MLRKSKQTHSGMLHQSRTLEGTAADNCRSQAKRAVPARNGKAVSQPSRGERGNRTRLSPLPTPDKVESGGVTRSFVLGKDKCPLMPSHPARIRQLLKKCRAVIHRQIPFVLRLKQTSTQGVQPVELKLDPGSRTTGLALVSQNKVLSLIELAHRGLSIRDALTQRRAFRRSRRNRKTRYRAPRFLNRAKPIGWLPPSLLHRVDGISSWVKRLRSWIPISSICAEAVRFDTHLLLNPDIDGIEYQQGELAGYEVREYLLEKWGRQCAYCDAENVPLQIEHIQPKSKGGSNRISNLTLACCSCNQRKDNIHIQDFLVNDPERLKTILAQAKVPLCDAAAVNATRKMLISKLRQTGLPLSEWTGGRTKFNRRKLSIPKTHALDAACVGEVNQLSGWSQPTLSIKCCGRGDRKLTRLTKDGFPRAYLRGGKSAFGFRTGDLVRASVPRGKKIGTYQGRVAIRSSGSFNIQSSSGTVQGISHKFCSLIQRGDGYNYHKTRPNTCEPSSSGLALVVSGSSIL